MISSRIATVPAYAPPKPGGGGALSSIHTDYSAITQKNLFNPGIKTGPAPISAEIGPCTLPFHLVGTILTGDKKEAVAIIENNSTKEQNLYHINDTLAQGAVINQINRLEVIITNNGRRERMSIEFGEIVPGQMAKTSFGALPAGSQVAKIGENQVMMDKRFFDAQKSNMNDLMTQIRAVPHMGAEGTINGFQLFEIVKESIYDKVGLKNQDVLKRVNGQAINSVEGGLDLFNALKNDNHFTLDIVRNNQNKTITVDIQ